MTNQQIFDKVARGLLTQNQKAADADGACKYRLKTAEGRTLKCGAGMLIPDKLYHPSMEGKTFHVLSDSNKDLLPALGLALEQADYVGIVSRLQTVHDRNEPGDWKEKLTALAVEFRLATKVLNKF